MQRRENAPQMVLIAEKITLLDKGRKLKLEDEEWKFRLNCLITPRGHLSYVEISEKREKIFSLRVEISGYLSFEGLLDKDDFDDDSEEWYEEGDEYDDAYWNYINKDVSNLVLMASEDGKRLVVILYDYDFKAFAMVFGNIDSSQSDMKTLDEYANSLKNMAWITRVFYAEE